VHTILVVLAALLFVLLTNTPLRAQVDASAENLLAGAQALRCAFTVSARTTWRNGVPQPVIRPGGNFIVNIREIKGDGGSAVLAVGNGGKDLTLVAAEQNRYFIDVGGARIAMTTVLAEFTTGTRLKASHIQSDYVALEVGTFKSEPDIVQYGGDCEVVQ
jgi:hypothetical protein